MILHVLGSCRKVWDDNSSIQRAIKHHGLAAVGLQPDPDAAADGEDGGEGEEQGDAPRRLLTPAQVNSMLTSWDAQEKVVSEVLGPVLNSLNAQTGSYDITLLPHPRSLRRVYAKAGDSSEDLLNAFCSRCRPSVILPPHSLLPMFKE